MKRQKVTNILFVDDDLQYSKANAEAIQCLRPVNVILAASVEETAKYLDEKFDIIVWTYILPDGDTGSLIRSFRERHPKVRMVANGMSDNCRKTQMSAGCNVEAGPFLRAEVFIKKVLGSA